MPRPASSAALRRARSDRARWWRRRPRGRRRWSRALRRVHDPRVQQQPVERTAAADRCGRGAHRTRGCSCPEAASRPRSAASGFRRRRAARAAISRFGLRPVMYTRAPAPTSCSHGEESQARIRSRDQVRAPGQVGEPLGVPRLLSCHVFDPRPLPPTFGAALRSHEEFEIGAVGGSGPADRLSPCGPAPTSNAGSPTWTACSCTRTTPFPARPSCCSSGATPGTPFLVLTNNSIFTPRDLRGAAAGVRAGRARGARSGPRPSRRPTSCTAQLPGGTRVRDRRGRAHDRPARGRLHHDRDRPRLRRASARPATTRSRRSRRRSGFIGSRRAVHRHEPRCHRPVGRRRAAGDRRDRRAHHEGDRQGALRRRQAEPDDVPLGAQPDRRALREHRHDRRPHGHRHRRRHRGRPAHRARAHRHQRPGRDRALSRSVPTRSSTRSPTCWRTIRSRPKTAGHRSDGRARRRRARRSRRMPRPGARGSRRTIATSKGAWLVRPVPGSDLELDRLRGRDPARAVLRLDRRARCAASTSAPAGSGSHRVARRAAGPRRTRLG